MNRVLGFLIGVLLLAVPAFATTYTVQNSTPPASGTASCAPGDILAWANYAMGQGSGNTIQVTTPCDGVTHPAWTTTLTINPTAPLTIAANSPCSLNFTALTHSCSIVILTDVGSGIPITINNCLAADRVDIQGFQFESNHGASNAGYINFNCNNSNGEPQVAGGFHNNYMNGTGLIDDSISSNGGRFVVFGGVYGVVDNNFFITTDSTISGDPNSGLGNITMEGDNNITTSYSYHQALNFGDNSHTLMIEHNFMSFKSLGQSNGASDNYNGCRVVIRFNIIYNNNVGFHGLDSGNRGCPAWEIYMNTFVANTNTGSTVVFQPRSGTGYIWGNTIKNVTGTSGFTPPLFSPILYAAIDQSGVAGDTNVAISERASLGISVPTAPWQGAFQGMNTAYNDNKGNFLTGSQPVDGNFIGPGVFDTTNPTSSLNARSISDMNTTSGSATISSMTPFTSQDVSRDMAGTNIQPRIVVNDATWSTTNFTVTSPTANFTVGINGREVGDGAGAQNGSIPKGTTITFVNSTTATLSNMPTASFTGNGFLVVVGPYITAVGGSSCPCTATMNSPATGNTSAGNLTIGFLAQGYPALDQVGWLNFTTTNSGANPWPTLTTGYSTANFEQLHPVYLAANTWITGVTNSAPTYPGGTASDPADTVVSHDGEQPFYHANREYYDQVTGAANQCALGTGASRTGCGLAANIPNGAGGACTNGAGYWAPDVGNWNASHLGSGITISGTTYYQGALFICGSPAHATSGHWASSIVAANADYIPGTYPYPGTTQGNSQSFTQQPGNVVNGSAFSPAVAGVLTSTTTDTMVLSCSAGCTLGGTTSVTSAGGSSNTYSFPGVTASGVGTGYTLTVTDSSDGTVANITSVTFNITSPATPNGARGRLRAALDDLRHAFNRQMQSAMMMRFY